MARNSRNIRRFDGDIRLGLIIRTFRWRIAITWSIVLVENALIAFIPLLIGLSIDGLLAGRFEELTLLGGVLVGLVLVAVVRRVYDTRVYGAIRMTLGSELQTRYRDLPISARTARIDMSRELVDFLEEQVPQLITAIIQIVVSFGVLAFFSWQLGLSSLCVFVGMLLVYSLFHRRFYRINAALNAQREKQVDILSVGARVAVFRHFRALRHNEVRISDTEAAVYGGIFLLQIAFILANLWIGSQLEGITAGKIFSIATYSWEYVESALMLPLALQQWSRLSEITARINNDKPVDG